MCQNVNDRKSGIDINATRSIAAGVSASRGVRREFDVLKELDPNQESKREVETKESMVQEAIDQWPAAIGFKEFPELKLAILDAAISDMHKILQSKLYCPQGQDIT